MLSILDGGYHLKSIVLDLCVMVFDSTCDPKKSCPLMWFGRIQLCDLKIGTITAVTSGKIWMSPMYEVVNGTGVSEGC